MFFKEFLLRNIYLWLLKKMGHFMLKHICKTQLLTKFLFTYIFKYNNIGIFFQFRHNSNNQNL